EPLGQLLLADRPARRRGGHLAVDLLVAKLHVLVLARDVEQPPGQGHQGTQGGGVAVDEEPVAPAAGGVVPRQVQVILSVLAGRR
ncbi:MAG: hypothetical protein HGB17_14900, partial [Syntrophobacteraceae bacterium]|nr:hypothetical protein [Syntrophobacteraceae bacterium]